jgi:hypothetical protein
MATDAAPAVAMTPTEQAKDAGDTPGAAASQWRGSYTSVAGSLYIPADWKGVRWSGADNPSGVGTGLVTMTIDPVTHRVRGNLEGPLGPAAVEGYAADGQVTAKLTRTDPNDRGFAGVLVATLDRDRGKGTMNVSLAEASALRTANFEVERVGAAAR